MKRLRDGARKLGLKLTADQLEAFQIYYQELVAWNRRVNLTAITDYEEVQIKHFLDSLSCLLVLPAGETLSMVDIGTGAGFPGLPLKIARPGGRLTLLESVGKKVAFLRELVERLELEGVAVVNGRAEEVGHDPAHRAQYDVALARAVAELPVLVEYALPLCRVGGLFVAQKGARIEEEVEGALDALEILGGRLKGIEALCLPTMDEPRHLVIVEKVAPTPERYPRRPGIPVRRPLR
jgi:16S rRNA (guanine527-N7)-methyltransferase